MPSSTLSLLLVAKNSVVVFQSASDIMKSLILLGYAVNFFQNIHIAVQIAKK